MDALVRCQRQDPDLDTVHFLPTNPLGKLTNLNFINAKNAVNIAEVH
jgi:hypothetical protein